MVSRDVAGEDAVPEAIIAARCADEHTDDPMRIMQLRDCETTTFCPTHSQAPLPKTQTYPTPRRAKFGPREGSLCMRHLCEHFPLSQLRFCADTSDITCPRCACICNARKRPTKLMGKCSRHCASSRIFGPGTVVAESDVYRCMQRANGFRVKYDISCRCALKSILRDTMS